MMAAVFGVHLTCLSCYLSAIFALKNQTTVTCLHKVYMKLKNSFLIPSIHTHMHAYVYVHTAQVVLCASFPPF